MTPKRSVALAVGSIVGLVLAQAACDAAVEVGADAPDAGGTHATTQPGSSSETPSARSSLVGSPSSGSPSATTGSASLGTTCGDGFCGSGENCVTCPQDCGSCTGSSSVTATATVSASSGTCVPLTCAQANHTGMCGGIFSNGCGGLVDCTALCGASSSASASASSSGSCGDGVCAAGEDCSDCPQDCGSCASSGSSSEGCDCCPLTCAALGLTCGIAGDGCGGVLVCGDYTTWQTTTLHGGGSPCVTSDANGVYTTCDDGTPVATIVLGPNEALQAITLTVIGETEGSTVQMSGLLGGTGGLDSELKTGTVVSSDGGPASSTPSGIYYAAGSSATITLAVEQGFTPNNPAGDIVEFEVSYQVSQCAGSTTSASSGSGGSCGTPITCAEAGVTCGLIGDGCGGIFNCGSCDGGAMTSPGSASGSAG